MGPPNYSRPGTIAPLCNLEGPRNSRFPKDTRYFGSFTLSCDPVPTRWAALLPTASKYQRGSFIAFKRRFNTSRSSSSGSNCKYFSNVVDAALRSPSL